MKSLGRHVKFLFVGLLLVSAILLLMTTTVVRRVWDYNGLSYDFSSSPEILEGVIQQQVDVCLIRPPSGNPQFLMDDADSFEPLKDKTIKETSRHTLINTLAKFSDVMEVMGIKTGIIEPSILFCMLTWPQKQLLMKRNFNVSDVVGSKNTVTLGIFAKDAELLEQLRFSKQKILEWMDMNWLLHYDNTASINTLETKQFKDGRETRCGSSSLVTLAFGSE